MADASALAEDSWPERYDLDLESLQDPESEEPFLRASFDLLKESAGLLT